jgi:hypothetical protein
LVARGKTRYLYTNRDSRAVPLRPIQRDIVGFSKDIYPAEADAQRPLFVFIKPVSINHLPHPGGMSHEAQKY